MASDLKDKMSISIRYERSGEREDKARDWCSELSAYLDLQMENTHQERNRNQKQARMNKKVFKFEHNKIIDLLSAQAVSELV